MFEENGDDARAKHTRQTHYIGPLYTRDYTAHTNKRNNNNKNKKKKSEKALHHHQQPSHGHVEYLLKIWA